jgi:hypothetical protein
MRKSRADWTAVTAALASHQLRTLQDFAQARGLKRSEWPSDPICGLVAATLAVESITRNCIDSGMTERQALVQAAVSCDLDVETLLRRRRQVRKRLQ